MTGFSFKVEDSQITASLHRLIALGRDAGPVMAYIAAQGESSTSMRFRTETGPDGQKWKPSLRARLIGGRTLTDEGDLARSISGRHGSDFAEWGVNRIYAANPSFWRRYPRQGRVAALSPSQRRRCPGQEGDDAGTAVPRGFRRRSRRHLEFHRSAYQRSLSARAPRAPERLTRRGMVDASNACQSFCAIFGTATSPGFTSRHIPEAPASSQTFAAD